jgi:hypothetical protein
MASFEEDIEAVFNDMHDRYFKILTKYYPAHGSTGFPERNLTHNFVTAFEMTLQRRCVSWFEAPIDLERNLHIDAVIFDVEEGRNIMIEAKRISNPNQKLIGIKEDLQRLRKPEHYRLLEKGLHDVAIKERYAVILADVWTETESKRNVFYGWPQIALDARNILWSGTKKFSALDVEGDWKHDYTLLAAAVRI